MKKHRSALHRLIHTLGVHPQHIETILPQAVKLGTPSPFNTHISDNKKESVADFRQLRHQTLVFTDSSCTDSLIGTAAVLYVTYIHISTLWYHLGSKEHHMVFEAEAVGLILAAHLLLARNEASFPALILTDNQAVI